MSQTPITVSYTLEEVLTRLEGKIDRLDEKIDKVEERLTKLEIGQAALTEKVEGIGKRLEKVENEQTNLVKAVSDFKGVKSLIIPIIVAAITAFLTLFVRSIPFPKL
jgi:septation ring formation regulator EzrA